MRRPAGGPFALFMFVTLLVLLPATDAFAHAERQSSEPKEGKTLKEPPQHIYVNFSEPPTGDAKITVTDGCGNDVVADFEVTDRTIHANLEVGQPGTYDVTTQVVSGLDGHETSDEWSFDVSGTKDCAAPPPEAEPGDPGEEDDGLSSVALLAAGGAVVLIGVAAAIRLRSK